MDQTMIDVSHIPDVRVGDQVVLIGSQQEETITVEEIAERLGTINYEVVSVIMARVPRSLPESSGPSALDRGHDELSEL
jgi:alanine racemase